MAEMPKDCRSNPGHVPDAGWRKTEFFTSLLNAGTGIGALARRVPRLSVSGVLDPACRAVAQPPVTL
jgi:hypothetical protein